MFEDKSDTVTVEDHASALAAMLDAAPVEVQGKPDVLPTAIEELPAPPPEKPKWPKPRVRIEVREVQGKQLRCVLVEPGFAMIGYALDDCKGGRCIPIALIEPRRGRTPRSSKRKG